MIEQFKNKEPNFLIIGAARSGTTSLYKYLQQHPEIYLPKEKRPEPHFFLKEEEFNKGYEYYINKYFSMADKESIKGEASTSYLLHPYVAKRIKTYLPNCKLIIMLRNPFERAISNYNVTFNNGFEKLNFNEAIKYESTRIESPKNLFEKEIQPYAYLKRGAYFEQISEYLKYFDIEQIHIIDFDDFIVNTKYELKKLIDFLGVDDIHYSFKTIEKQNISNLTTTINIEESIWQLYLDTLKNDISSLSFLLNKDFSKWLKK